MPVHIWHLGLILRSDCFNQSWLKKSSAQYVQEGAASSETANFLASGLFLYKGYPLETG